MKKTLVLFLAATLLFSCTACGRKDKKKEVSPAVSPSAAATAPTTANAEQESKTTNEKASSTPVPPSSNKETVSDEEAPSEIYWLISDTNNLTYHLKDCKEIKGKEAQKVDWNLVKTIGLRQCPECNPPQYEGYADTE